MPFLSNIFDPEAQDDGGASGRSQSDSAETNAGADADVDFTLSVRTETTVEYETEDESGGYTHATDVTLTVSADALLGAVTDASFEEGSETA